MNRLPRLLLLLVVVPLLAACGDDPLPGGSDAAVGTDAVTLDTGQTDLPAADLEAAADPGSLIDLGSTPDAATDAASDTGPSCSTVTPFVPTGPTTDWRHSTQTGVLTVTQGSPNHRGQDVISAVGGPQVLVGKFAYGAFDKDLKDEDVEIFVLDDPPCGPWVSLGVLQTSEDGEYGTQYGIEDDGGRIFYTFPPELARPAGTHPIRMLVHGDHSVAAFNLYVLEPNTSTVVFDIDGTLTTDDFELVSELFSDIFNGSYVPEMYPDARETTQAWQGADHFIVFMTARPDWLRRMTSESLIAEGFPRAALHFTDTTGQVLPTSSGTGQYKTDFLNLLKSQAQVDFVAAYGNASTDIEAYEAAGIPKDITYIIGDNGGTAGTTAIESYTAHLPTITPVAVAPVAGPPNYGWE